jgi:hypothetical protein
MYCANIVRNPVKEIMDLPYPRTRTKKIKKDDSELVMQD